MVQKTYAILAVVIIVIVAVAAVVVLGGAFKEKPNLQVTAQTLSGKIGDTATLTFQITNVGGDANGVAITASSDAFANAAISKVDILASKTVTVSCQVNVNDVESKDYPVTLAYTAQGSLFSGSVSGNVLGNAEFYVIPSLEVTNIQWQAGNNQLSNGQFTRLYFSVKSNTNYQVQGAQIALSVVSSNTGIIIDPNNFELSTINPQATGEQNVAAVQPINTPAGTYTIQFIVTYGDYEVATATTTLVVTG